MGKGEGIYVYRMDLTSGTLEFTRKITDVTNPSYLAFDPKQRFLYAVNELKSFEGKPTGTVSAFSVDSETGELEFLNKKMTHGTDPCYVVVDKTGRYVFVANFMSGSVCVLPIREDGSLGDPTDFIQHHGSSVNPERQREPHAHSIAIDPSNRYVYAADLGLDKIMIYKFDSEEGKLTPNNPPWVKIKPGAGPRHFTFYPNEKFAYVINELNSTIVAFAYDRNDGTLKKIQTVSTLPEGFKDVNYCADIHIAPSGKFLYGSNRGHDSIVIYRINEESGKLTYVGCESAEGKTPRNFAIDPTGRFLLAANQDTDTIVTFHIDQKTGRLSPTGNVTEVPTPVCIKMISP